MKIKPLASYRYLLIGLLILAISYVDAEEFTVEIDAKYSHPNRAFTQGIIVDDGIIIESSGRYNKSFVQSYHVGDNAAVKLKRLPGHYFGEGLEKLADEIFVLTWKERSVLVLNANDFSLQRKMRYQGEGWGLTTEGMYLVMSNGSNIITFRNKENFNIVRQIAVTDKAGPVKFLNELEWIEGKLYANIWQQDLLVVIDPKNGRVIQRIDLSPLRAQLDNKQADVINGIAWDEANKKLYLTGKLWPWLFSVSIVEK
ncbi:MAG: glutamine cyclotransferase [Pseudomonadales bacterium]